MKKNTIRLTESQLHNIISESVKIVLKEEQMEWEGFYEQMKSLEKQIKNLENESFHLLTSLIKGGQDKESSIERMKEISEQVKEMEDKRIEALENYQNSVYNEYGFKPSDAKSKIDYYNDYVRRNGSKELPLNVYISNNGAEDFLDRKYILDMKYLRQY